MRPSCRQLFVWAFAAFFAGISLLGQGLHYFVEHGSHDAPSHGHLAGHDHPAAHEEHGHAHEFDHAWAGGEHRHHAADRDAVTIAAGTSHPHDCTICAFFAQAQRVLDFEPPALEFVSVPVIHAAEQAIRVPCLGIYHSRAPPSGSPIC